MLLIANYAPCNVAVGHFHLHFQSICLILTHQLLQLIMEP